jgi:hypothetical protein
MVIDAVEGLLDVDLQPARRCFLPADGEHVGGGIEAVHVQSRLDVGEQQASGATADVQIGTVVFCNLAISISRRTVGNCLRDYSPAQTTRQCVFAWARLPII